MEGNLGFKQTIILLIAFLRKGIFVLHEFALADYSGRKAPSLKMGSVCIFIITRPRPKAGGRVLKWAPFVFRILIIIFFWGGGGGVDFRSYAD